MITLTKDFIQEISNQSEALLKYISAHELEIIDDECLLFIYVAKDCAYKICNEAKRLLEEGSLPES